MEKTYYVFKNGCQCEALFNFTQDSTSWLPNPNDSLGQGLGNQFSDNQLASGVKDKLKGHSWNYFDFCMEKVFRVTDGNCVYEARTNPKVVHSMVASDGCYDSDHIYERLIEDALANVRVYKVEETLTQKEFEIRKRDEILSLDFNASDTSTNIRKFDFQYRPSFIEDNCYVNRVDSFSLICNAEIYVGFKPFASVPIEVTATGMGKNLRQWSKPSIMVRYEDACFYGGAPLLESEYPEAFELVKSQTESNVKKEENFLLEIFKDRQKLTLNFLPNNFSLPKPTQSYEYTDKDGIKHSEALPCVPCRIEAELSDWLKCVALTRLPEMAEYEKASQVRLDPGKNGSISQLIDRALANIAVTDGRTVFCADATSYYGFSQDHADNVGKLWIRPTGNYVVTSTQKLSPTTTQTVDAFRVKSR